MGIRVVRVIKNRAASLALLCGVTVIGLVGAELLLRQFAPIPFLTIGRTDSPNAMLYGWGFNPKDGIVLTDPDSGQIFHERLNNFGWRDVDRSARREPSTLRILAIGDSNTFGPIVRGDQTYPRMLEGLLQADGIKAEVFNIAYGGWSTDQQLEALIREGRRFQPNLVVLQFCSNDLSENFAKSEGPYAKQKPFRYRLTGAGTLEREINPDFRAQGSPIKQMVRALVPNFELSKRAVLAYRAAMGGVEAIAPAPYQVSRAQIQRNLRLLGVQDGSPLHDYYWSHVGIPLNAADLSSAIERSGMAVRTAEILRLSENRPFLARGVNLEPSPADPSSAEWTLYLALLDAFRSQAVDIGAPILLISDNEAGLYEWERYWGRVFGGEDLKRNFLSPNDLLRDFARRHEPDVTFVEMVAPINRARNDPHPNAEGNRVIANTLFRHLIERHSALLSQYRQ